MTSLRLFGLKRKLFILCSFEGFFDPDCYREHSRAMEGKEDEKWVQKGNFLANCKSLNEFNNKKLYLLNKN
ncbi:hypothetical protein CSW08_11315 [Confluentibacter flavum]|uniref:Uncharacterized protein n=1 Tax=Confluentibacter flavum TaxID=1909700 RepID=A0A2N3HIT1_9FLAO|nr:hypothetical protein CSW08_11315 [Confluentibacter flavum]